MCTAADFGVVTQLWNEKTLMEKQPELLMFIHATKYVEISLVACTT